MPSAKGYDERAKTRRLFGLDTKLMLGYARYMQRGLICPRMRTLEVLLKVNVRSEGILPGSACSLRISENAAGPAKGEGMKKSKHDYKVTPSNWCTQVQSGCLALAMVQFVDKSNRSLETHSVGQSQAMRLL